MCLVSPADTIPPSEKGWLWPERSHRGGGSPSWNLFSPGHHWEDLQGVLGQMGGKIKNLERSAGSSLTAIEGRWHIMLVITLNISSNLSSFINHVCGLLGISNVIVSHFIWTVWKCSYSNAFLIETYQANVLEIKKNLKLNHIFWVVHLH